MPSVTAGCADPDPLPAAAALEIISVALFTPLRRSFDYLLPEDLRAAQAPVPGQRVLVPFGRARRIGIALERKAASSIDVARLKPIAEVLDRLPVFDGEALALAHWAATYYQHPLGDVLGNMLPVWLRRHREPPLVKAACWELSAAGAEALGAARVRAPRQLEVLARFAHGPAGVAQFADAEFGWRSVVKRLLTLGLLRAAPAPALMPFAASALALNAEQQVAAQVIVAARGHFRAVLLQGVTGSGKTEVYLTAIADCLAHGGQALVLVPEIALTAQLVARFRARFGAAVGVMHSALSERERMLTWIDCETAAVRILIGTRSAVWARLPNLGLIIVDEEHDPSYKQQDGFRYSARDIALETMSASATAVETASTQTMSAKQLLS